MGVPCTLKNAIDWTDSSGDSFDKPTALITASSVGEKGPASLLETLKVLSVKISDATQLLVSHAKLKINNDGQITDEKTLTQVESLTRASDELLYTE